MCRLRASACEASGFIVRLAAIARESGRLSALHEEQGKRFISRELFYLTEIGFLHSRHDKHWRITALGRDFLFGLIEAKGVMDPVMLGDIGES